MLYPWAVDLILFSLLNKMGAQDPTSQSNYHQISTKHFSLDWSIDFYEKVIKGSVTHELTVHESDLEEVMCVRYPSTLCRYLCK